MDTPEYTTLAAALKRVPDPPSAAVSATPGILIMAALVRGERHGRGLGQWVQEPAAE